MNSNYYVELSFAINQRLDEINELQKQIEELRVSNSDKFAVIYERLKIDWTYTTNAIEGNSLSRGETLFFLQEGLTVEGKPFKDFLDARNHAQAIDFLFEVIKGQRPLTESFLKELHALLLSGVTHTDAIDSQGARVKKPLRPGQYKTLPNHVLQLDGTIHRYSEPVHVTVHMQELISFIDVNMTVLPPLITASIAHYNLVRIHPFDDGNGRCARLLMNLILMKNALPPAIIKNEDRRIYLECIQKADKGELEHFVSFVANSLIRTQEEIIKEAL